VKSSIAKVSMNSSGLGRSLNGTEKTTLMSEILTGFLWILIVKLQSHIMEGFYCLHNTIEILDSVVINVVPGSDC
jgi:hypothetical protein